MELVAGGTGYVGSRVLSRLRSEGRAVRVLSRSATGIRAAPGTEVVRGDLLSGAGIERALDGCTVAYYLVHSMEAPGEAAGPGFAERDRIAAHTFAAAAAVAGVERIVYLGGILPADGMLSAHLASRLEVERILLEGEVPATALRASIVIGAHSPSFRILVRLVERLRVLPLPSWRGNRTQPVAERDAVECLVRTPLVPETANGSFDIAGPEVLSYGEMIVRLAEEIGVGRMPLNLGLSLTPPASAMVSAITGQPLELVRPLMESLESDLLPRDPTVVQDLYGIRPLAFERAVERALLEWESHEELAAR